MLFEFAVKGLCAQSAVSEPRRPLSRAELKIVEKLFQTTMNLLCLDSNYDLSLIYQSLFVPFASARKELSKFPDNGYYDQKQNARCTMTVLKFLGGAVKALQRSLTQLYCAVYPPTSGILLFSEGADLFFSSILPHWIRCQVPFHGHSCFYVSISPTILQKLWEHEAVRIQELRKHCTRRESMHYGMQCIQSPALPPSHYLPDWNATLQSLMGLDIAKLHQSSCPYLSKLTPLTFAVVSGIEESVAELISEGSDINEMDLLGQSPFLLACRLGNFNMVKLFCACDVLNWDVKDTLTGGNALHMAMSGGNEKILCYLLENYYDLPIIRSQNCNLASDNSFCIGPLVEEDREGCCTPLDIALATRGTHLAIHLLLRGVPIEGGDSKIEIIPFRLQHERGQIIDAGNRVTTIVDARFGPFIHQLKEALTNIGLGDEILIPIQLQTYRAALHSIVADAAWIVPRTVLNFQRFDKLLPSLEFFGYFEPGTEISGDVRELLEMLACILDELSTCEHISSQEMAMKTLQKFHQSLEAYSTFDYLRKTADSVNVTVDGGPTEILLLRWKKLHYFVDILQRISASPMSYNANLFFAHLKIVDDIYNVVADTCDTMCPDDRSRFDEIASMIAEHMSNWQTRLFRGLLSAEEQYELRSLSEEKRGKWLWDKITTPLKEIIAGTEEIFAFYKNSLTNVGQKSEISID